MGFGGGALIPLSVLFSFPVFFGVVSTLAFFIVTRAFGGSKKRSFDEKNAGRKFQNTGTEPFWGQKTQKRANKQRNCAFLG